MTFSEYIQLLQIVDQNHIHATISKLKSASDSHSRFCENIWKECRVDTDFWQGVATILLKTTTTGNVEAIIEELRSFFRDKPCCGEPIKSHNPVHLGRVFSKQRLSALHGNAEKISNLDAQSVIEGMLLPADFSDIPIDPADNLLDRTPLGDHGKMWSTFDDADDAATLQPRYASEPLKKTQCCFGLPYCDDLSIFLEYSAASVTLRFPTIADAYAGLDLNDAYEPSGINDSCGRTRPNDDCPHHGACGVPECVHEVINGSRLTRRPIGLKK